MNKTYTIQYADGSGQDVGSKKTAVKYGDASGKSYKVLSPSGAVVHEVDVPDPKAPVKQPESVEKEPVPTVEEVALKHSVSFTLPGNYSIVTAPMVRSWAEAAGLVAHEVRFAGKLERRVDVSSNNKAELEKFSKMGHSCLEEVMVQLRMWQKDNIEKRRGLTDMQKFVQHREFITAYGQKVVKQIKKGLLP